MAKQQRSSGRKKGNPQVKACTKDGRSPIAPASRLPIATLQMNYGVDLDGTMRIHALSPEGRFAKARFLHDAWRYAHALGQTLALYGGFTESKVVKNQGRAAEGGNIIAYYYHPLLAHWLAIYIESDREKTALPRLDGVIVTACKHSNKREVQNDGRFHYLNPALSSLHLAQVLLLLMGKKTWADVQQFVWDESQSGATNGSVLTQAKAQHGVIIRVSLLGDYRWCVLLQPGWSSVEVCCIDEHLAVALAYWGKRVKIPMRYVHPDDVAKAHIPGESPFLAEDHANLG